MSENKNVVEVRGCIVCAKLFDIFAPDGRLVDCAVTSPREVTVCQMNDDRWLFVMLIQ